MNWLPKLHKTLYKSRFISASSKCITTDVSILLTCAITTIKTLIVNFCNRYYENSSITYFMSVDVLNKLKAVKVPFATIDSYDFLLFIPLYHTSLLRKSFHI